MVELPPHPVYGVVRVELSYQRGEIRQRLWQRAPRWENYPAALERLGLQAQRTAGEQSTPPTQEEIIAAAVAHAKAGAPATAPSGASNDMVAEATKPESTQTEQKTILAKNVPTFPALSNTVVITTLTLIGQVLSCSLVGFGFARFKFRGRNLLFIIMLSTMMLPAQVTMIPVFVLFKSLGLVDTIWPLVLPAFFAAPFFVFMFRQFFSQIPEELIEAARIDGCSNWRIYWQLMLPLSGPVIAIVAIYTFLGAWNDFMGPLIYLNSPENRTLSLALNVFRGQYGTTDAHLLMAASVICMLPCVILFFACQRYFVESVASTGLKS
jgi:ABC-type glycerol-3-phosphate transport system permease component